MQNNELEQENNHIKFWKDCLNDLINQFKIVTNYLNFIKKIKSQKEMDLSELLIKYRKDSNNFSKEPSHIYYLCEIFLDFQSSLCGIIDKPANEVLNKIDSMSNEIIKDLEKKKN